MLTETDRLERNRRSLIYYYSNRERVAARYQSNREERLVAAKVYRDAHTEERKQYCQNNAHTELGVSSLPQTKTPRGTCFASVDIGANPPRDRRSDREFVSHSSVQPSGHPII